MTITEKKYACKRCGHPPPTKGNNTMKTTVNIYWRNLPKDIPLTMKGHVYVTPEGAVVYWMGHETVDAQRALNKRVKANKPLSENT